MNPFSCGLFLIRMRWRGLTSDYMMDIITRDNCILAILSHTCEYFSQVLANIFSQVWFSELSQVCKIVFRKYVKKSQVCNTISQVWSFIASMIYIYHKYVWISDIASMFDSNNVSMVNLFASMINCRKYDLNLSQVCTYEYVISQVCLTVIT